MPYPGGSDRTTTKTTDQVTTTNGVCGMPRVAPTPPPTALQKVPSPITRNALQPISFSKVSKLMAGKHERHHSVVAMSRNGAVVASAGFDGLAIHDAGSGEQLIWVAEPHGGRETSCIALSGDGKVVATGGCDGRVVVFDAETGSMKYEFEAAHAKQRVNAVSLSFDGEVLGHAGHDGKVVVRNLATQAMTSLVAHGGKYALGCSLSSDGSIVASCGSDNRVVMYRVATGQLIAEVIKAHPHRWINAVSLSRDGTRVVSGGQNGTIMFHDAANGQIVGRTKFGNSLVRGVATNESGTRCAVGMQDGRFVICSNIGTLLGEWKYPHGGGACLGVAMSADGERAASGGYDGQVMVYGGEAMVFCASPTSKR